MPLLISSISPKGQITIPVSIRDLLAVKPRDKILFEVERKTVRIIPMDSKLAKSFMSVPALKKPISLKEMTKIAHEEHALKQQKSYHD